MKKIIISLVTVIAAVAMTTSSFAADVAGTKVAVVQVAKILQDSPKVKKTSDELKKKFAPEQAKIEASQKTMQAAMDKLKKNEAVMSDDDKAAAEKKIADDRQALIKQITEFKQKVSTAQSDAMKEVFDALNLTIQAVAEEQGYDVVLDSQFVVYAAKTSDVTDAVEKAFNAEG